MIILALILTFSNGTSFERVYLGDFEQSDCVEIAEVMNTRLKPDTTASCRLPVNS